MLPIEEYRKMIERPTGPHVMYQRWRSLLFIHFACPAEEVQRLLPDGLTVDTFEDEAWVGLVLFRMDGVRFRGTPFSMAFPETNVRTYVHRAGADPGVWFFSLDATSKLGCMLGRALWGLEYHHSKMSIVEEGDEIQCRCRRSDGAAESCVMAKVGADLGPPEPGTLDYFLVERYLLYSQRGSRLFRGRVAHAPYKFRSAELSSVDDGLVECCGIRSRPASHVVFSPGADTKIFPLRRIR